MLLTLKNNMLDLFTLMAIRGDRHCIEVCFFTSNVSMDLIELLLESAPIRIPELQTTKN